MRTAHSEVAGFKPGQFTRLFSWRSHTFITDDWRVTPRLTVNLGLRYEYNSVLRDIRGGTRNFDFRTQDLFPEPGVSAPLYKPDYDNFAPRIGLAFRPFSDNKTVVRASYGVFYNVNMLNNLTESSKNIPFSAGINELNNAGQVRIRMSNAVVGVNAAATQAREVLAVPDNYGVGDAQQWTLNIQRALPGRHGLRDRLRGLEVESLRSAADIQRHQRSERRDPETVSAMGQHRVDYDRCLRELPWRS